MKPTRTHINLTAYGRWLRRGGGLIRDGRDWLEAELDLLFRMNYSQCVHYRLGGPTKQHIGDKRDRRCRFCGLTKPATTFKNTSHAIPELLGNKSLIAYDECDACNGRFSRTFEHDFDQFTRPMRTLLRIKGKSIPSFKTKDQRARIDYDARNNRFVILEHGERVISEPGDESNSIGFQLECQPYRPLGVYRCLVKMALAVMPSAELGNFDVARRWLLEPNAPTVLPASCWARCAFLFSPKPFTGPWAALYRKENESEDLPYMLFLVGSANIAFSIPVPFSPRDNRLIGTSVYCPRPDIPSEERLAGTEWQSLDLSSDAPECSQIFTTTMVYDSGSDISEEEFNNPSLRPV